MKPDRAMVPVLLLLLCLVLLPAAVLAQDEEADDAEAQEQEADPKDTIEEVIIVTASRTEQSMHEVPAAFTVITPDQIENAPADDYGDLLRNVPGLNVTQTSARDINISGRQATNTLATDQLVLLDGRSIYLDFFGFVMWDFLPVSPREIKQIEVVRGPGSAVWGANALSGVVNVITKTPREIDGGGVTVGGGELDTLYANVTQATAKDRVGYKVSAGYYQQDAYDRPTGLVPGTATPYPNFENSGTEQPKVDLRVDYDGADDSLWSFSGGWAQTDGIVHTGIGPFDIESGEASLGYVKASWSKRAMNANFFINKLDGDASNLLTVGLDGRPLLLGFETDTYNIDFSNTNLLGESHVLTYGVTARQNDFVLSIAPQGSDREEYGVFLQDEILIGDKVRWLIGARWDDIDPIGSVVSPRTSLLYSPSDNHTFRVSYNQAFRAPSVINGFLDTSIVNGVLVDPTLISAAIAPGIPCPFVLTTCDPFFYVFPTLALGNPDLVEESLDSYEIGYVGSFGSNVVSVSVYRTELEDSIDFFTAANYSAFNPPPGWPVFVAGTPIPAVPPGTFPSLFSYRNIGETINQGVEFSINGRPSIDWSWFVNYSWQDDSEVTGIDPSEVNQGPTSRFNAGLSYNGERFFANGNVNYSDGGFWTDVLDSRFHGPTEDYTQVNLGFGYHFNENMTLSVLGANVFDEDVQQHVFGDIISRKVTAELRFQW